MNFYKTIPAYKDYIWGGNKLKEYYGKKTDISPLAESWELSCHKDGMSYLSNGMSLEEYISNNKGCLGKLAIFFIRKSPKNIIKIKKRTNRSWCVKNTNSDCCETILIEWH